jgi:Transcription factor WhiB
MDGRPVPVGPWHCFRRDAAGRPADRYERAPALALCEVCPVRADCLAEALGEVWTKKGIWGGTTERDRATAAQRSQLRAGLQGTHLQCPGNLTLQCTRHHHLLHTPGWHAKLLPDNTLIVTTPDGRTLESQPPGRPPPRPPGAYVHMAGIAAAVGPL